MTAKKHILKLFLDEGVPNSIGHFFRDSGHEVIFLRDAIATGSPDQLVCAASEANDAILVALDGDMKKLASSHGVGSNRYRRLSLIKLSCRETRAMNRTKNAMSLIEHEWKYAASKNNRRLFVEIGDTFIKTNR